MVRVKKRYFVVELEKKNDILARVRPHNPGKRAFQSLAVQLSDQTLSKALRDLVLNFHGDHGLASVTGGLRIVYCNPITHLMLIASRHGPHRLVASVLPFLTEIDGSMFVPNLIYTGATVRNCYKMMKQHQEKRLEMALYELGNSATYSKERDILQKEMLILKEMEPT